MLPILVWFLKPGSPVLRNKPNEAIGLWGNCVGRPKEEGRASRECRENVTKEADSVCMHGGACACGLDLGGSCRCCYLDIHSQLPPLFLALLAFAE